VRWGAVVNSKRHSSGELRNKPNGFPCTFSLIPGSLLTGCSLGLYPGTRRCRACGALESNPGLPAVTVSTEGLEPEPFSLT
jgi:hypothetical protein